MIQCQCQGFAVMTCLSRSCRSGKESECQYRLKIPHSSGRKFPTPEPQKGASLASDGTQRRLLARFGRSGVRGQGSWGRRPLLSSRWHQAGPTTILQPIALTADVDRRRVMQEPVQYRRGDDRVAENRTPVTVALVRGQEDTAALVPPLMSWKKIVVPKSSSGK